MSESASESNFKPSIGLHEKFSHQRKKLLQEHTNLEDNRFVKRTFHFLYVSHFVFQNRT